MQKKSNLTLQKQHRENFLQNANKAYKKLKKDQKAWKEEQKELELWEATNLDGLQKNRKKTLFQPTSTNSNRI